VADHTYCFAKVKTMHVSFGPLAAASLVAALASAAPLPAQASGYAVIYTAPSGQTFEPAVGAVSNGLIYGTDPAGGAAGDGTVFTMTTKGQNYTVLHTFTGADGIDPNPRLLVLAGEVFGTTQWGGSTTLGTVYGMSAQGTLLWSNAFAEAQGFRPLDGLAYAANGDLYGTTSAGAIAPGNGTLFRVHRNGNLAILYKFQSQSDGHCPFTGVVVDAAGNVFGTTVGLGAGGNPNGSVWEMPPGETPATLDAFANGSVAEWPQITPTLDAAGNLWGVNEANPAQGNGVIWELSGTSFSVPYSFTGGADGYAPDGPLLLGKDGNLYGTTSGGGNANGSNGLGTVFMITPQGQLSTVHTFTGGADGGVPTGSLAMDAAGHIYGGTQAGTIFKISP